MAYDRLIWIDLEMTGLDPTHHRIIEISVIVTNNNLDILSIGPYITVHQSKKHIQKMNSWNKKTHTKNGIIKKVKKSTYTEKKAEKEIILFLKKWVPIKKSPLCGNSIYLDKQFLFKYMKKLALYFHYRSIDVSTIKELLHRWNPHLSEFKKNSIHTAQQDILYSIKELQYYRDFFCIYKNCAT